MKFCLSPRNDSTALSYSDIVSRLQSEFSDRMSVNDISEPDVDDMVAELIELDAPQEMIDDARTGVLLRVSIFDLEFSDDTVTFDLAPNTLSLVGYYPDTGNVLALLERCANALGYSLTID